MMPKRHRAIILQLISKRKRGCQTVNSEKKIPDMNRQEYSSYVQRHYRNDPQWVRTMLISKYDREHNTTKGE